MTKEKVQRIIDYYSDKTLSLGCRVIHTFKILGEVKWMKEGVIAQGYEAEGGRRYQIVASEDNGRQFMASFFEGDEWVKILGHPITIGRVLDKMNEIGVLRPEYSVRNHETLLALWISFGFTKSLQEIAECGWGEICYVCGTTKEECQNESDEPCSYFEQLKSPEARELFNFLDKVTPI